MKTKKIDIEQYDYVDTEEIQVLTKRYAYQIGKYFIKFSELEHNLNIQIAHTISDRSDQPGYRVVRYINGPTKKFEFLFETYKEILSYGDKQLTQEISIEYQELRELIKKHIEFRNKLAHANWASLTKEGFVRDSIIPDTNGRLQFRKLQITTSLIKSLIDEIDNIIDRLYEFEENLYEIF